MPVHNVHNKASLFSWSSKEFCRSSLYFQTLRACWEETYYNKQVRFIPQKHKQQKESCISRQFREGGHKSSSYHLQIVRHEQLWNVARGPSESTWYGISWHGLTPYHILQKKLMVHYLLLQSQGQVPPHVTTEHMSNWLVSQGKKSLRERWVPRQHSPSLPFPATSSTPGDVGKINNRKIRSQESWIALCFIWRVWNETLEEGNDLARLVREWELESYYKLVSSTSLSTTS